MATILDSLVRHLGLHVHPNHDRWCMRHRHLWMRVAEKERAMSRAVLKSLPIANPTAWGLGYSQAPPR